MNVQEQRKATKERHERYREILRSWGFKISSYAQVTESADGDGAFVEVTVWIPSAELERAKV